MTPNEKWEAELKRGLREKEPPSLSPPAMFRWLVLLTVLLGVAYICCGYSDPPII